MLNLPYESSLTPEMLQQASQYNIFNLPTYNQLSGSAMQPGTSPYALMRGRMEGRRLSRPVDLGQYQSPQIVAGQSPFSPQQVAALLKR